eukprot:TRINITY_DN10713_c0_g1_i3.p2 TRINITY_DN10713_c0_g1~~TRINITY_DN10713_c0_g1_i3.p2  ORF type:complete len:108 (-),score=3.04 TRINITY_DN10713_c0_g1_i3:287-610(-)
MAHVHRQLEAKAARVVVNSKGVATLEAWVGLIVPPNKPLCLVDCVAGVEAGLMLGSVPYQDGAVAKVERYHLDTTQSETQRRRLRQVHQTRAAMTAQTLSECQPSAL